MPEEHPIVGGIYAVEREDGRFKIAKVLALDELVVHIRCYANLFEGLPATLDPSTLVVGSLEDEHCGIGHFPLAREAFASEPFTLLMKDAVAEEELEGYRIYLEQMRGRAG